MTPAQSHESVCHTLHLMPHTLVQRGHEALARGAWEEARGAFETALQQARNPEALEGLGSSCWWLDDGAGVFEAREEAYRLYRERGDRAAAARMALFLYWDYRAFRGDAAVSNGWLQRAERLLEGLDSTREYGLAALPQGPGGSVRRSRSGGGARSRSGMPCDRSRSTLGGPRGRRVGARRFGARHPG